MMAGIRRLDRRKFLARLMGGTGAALLSGCDRLSANTWFSGLLDSAESLTKRAQRALVGHQALAPEFTEADLSPRFKSNGTSTPDDEGYQALARNGFTEWRLEVGGLVERPARLSLAELRALPARTQITRHDCVEGWSCIGKWTGARLSALLDRAVVKPAARYVMFYCADPMEETLDGADHPQTILAYAMNDKVLPIPYGAPLRLRAERQLGYKMAKYIMRIELVESLAQIRGGKGGYWEDQGYEWYAGIQRAASDSVIRIQILS